MDIIGLLLIFFARVLDVSCNTIRIIFLVRGRRGVAAFIGFFEVMIYMVVLGRILGGGRVLTVPELIFFCGGFAAGNYVGSFLESRFMETCILCEAIVDDDEVGHGVVEDIRNADFGATVVRAEGRYGAKLLVEIFCRRSEVKQISEIVGDRGFVSMSDVRSTLGGWFPSKRK